jgi:hypothetical protein
MKPAPLAKRIFDFIAWYERMSELDRSPEERIGARLDDFETRLRRLESQDDPNCAAPETEADLQYRRQAR